MKIHYKLISLAIIVLIGLSQHTLAANSPYPPSPVIENISWDFANLVRLAPGSDLWPVTWASDNNLYTSWGDGGGFGGTNTDGRVSLGFARIEGPPGDLVGYNVWGGKDAENPAQFGGKCPGILSVNGVLYAWINLQNAAQPDFKLAWSEDLGAHWQLADWNFTGNTFGENTFLNFGENYSGARDGFVYVYGINREAYMSVELARVPKGSLRDRTAYQWFTGLDADKNPTWSADITQRQPVFEDPNGVGIASVIYNPGINRYILTTAHGPHSDGIRRLGVFDAPEPWGPWTTVEYNENWGGFSGFWLGYYIPTKTPDWMSADGKTIHLIFSGQGDLDSFNLVKATLTLKEPIHPLVISNLTVAGGKPYEVVYNGLEIGALVYIDRTYTYSSVPNWLKGSTYIKTANDDKDSTGASFMTFEVNQDVTVYVAHDDRIATEPSWLVSFTDSGADLAISGTTFSIFAKDFMAGTITLGGNEGGGGNSMYTVIVVGSDSNPPAPPTGLKIM